jgi:hypothetical protein
MPHGPLQAQRRDRLHFLKLDPLPATRHSRDSAEQVAFGNRRVFLGQRVATGNNKGLRVHLYHTDDAVGAKTPVAQEENDLSRPHANGGFPQNQKSVTRKDGREHA